MVKVQPQVGVKCSALFFSESLLGWSQLQPPSPAPDAAHMPSRPVQPANANDVVRWRYHLQQRRSVHHSRPESPIDSSDHTAARSVLDPMEKCLWGYGRV